MYTENDKKNDFVSEKNGLYAFHLQVLDIVLDT